MKIVLIALILTLGTALKIAPLLMLTEDNFQVATGVDFDTFLRRGSLDQAPWFLLFKINGCQHCKQAEELFNSYYIEYNKRKHFQHDVATLLQTNMHIAIVDWQIERYSVNTVHLFAVNSISNIEGDGHVCAYQGGRSHFDILSFMEDRYRGDHSKCKSIGKITIWTKFFSYFQPLQTLIDNNVVMFIIAFVIGPFLFGFLFSRNKKLKQQQLAVQKQN